jgi:hypothetical protein
MYIGISLEFQRVSIGFASSRFKFGIHWENDHVKLLNFGISIDPSEVGLLILGLNKLRMYSFNNDFPFGLARLNFVNFFVDDKSPCFDLELRKSHLILKFISNGKL